MISWQEMTGEGKHKWPKQDCHAAGGDPRLGRANRMSSNGFLEVFTETQELSKQGL